jgi:hypothetical protein
MPQSVKSLSSGYSNTVVGMLVMFPQLTGLAVMILVSRSSDRTLSRQYHAAIPPIVAGVVGPSAIGGVEGTRSHACLSEPLRVAIQQRTARGILQRNRDRRSGVEREFVYRIQ